LEREVFSKFAAMSEEQLIALAIPYYPEWRTTVTVSNEIATMKVSNQIAAQWRDAEPLVEPGTFRLPIQDIGIRFLHNLLADPAVPPHERELLRAEKERRDEEERSIPF
jgi:hypothetical protein